MFGRLAELAVIVWIHEKGLCWILLIIHDLGLLSSAVEFWNSKRACVCVIRRLTDNWYCWALACRPFFPPKKYVQPPSAVTFCPVSYSSSPLSSLLYLTRRFSDLSSLPLSLDLYLPHLFSLSFNFFLHLCLRFLWSFVWFKGKKHSDTLENLKFIIYVVLDRLWKFNRNTKKIKVLLVYVPQQYKQACSSCLSAPFVGVIAWSLIFDSF